jgi:hypothetical protein
MFNLNDKTHFMPSCGEVNTVAMPKHVFGFVLDTFIWHCSSHIRELNIRGFPLTVVGPLDPKNDLTNSSLFIMAAKCNLLELVDFSYRECITDDGMSALLSVNPHMMRVYCESCTNIGSGTINAASVHCPRLEVLNMSGCRDIADDCLMRLATGCPLLTHLGLKHLDTNSTKNVTKLSMDMLVKKCKRLQFIYRTMPELSYSVKIGGFYDRTHGPQQLQQQQLEIQQSEEEKKTNC